jgi:hypothetical protein
VDKSPFRCSLWLTNDRQAISLRWYRRVVRLAEFDRLLSSARFIERIDLSRLS